MSITPMLQNATWKERTTGGVYGPTYTNHSITCRFVQETKLIKQKNEDVISIAKVTCVEAVKADDFIIYNSIQYPVLTVKDKLGIGGEVIERIVRLGA